MNENIQVFDIANELIIIPKAVIDEFLKHKNPSELIALYSFYYYTAKWQKTNQPKCSTNYVAKGLHWKPDKVRRIKKELINIGLVKDIKDIDNQTHKIKGWYIKVNYVFKRSTVNNIIDNEKATLPQNQEGGNNHSVDLGTTNALSSNNLNALSSNKKKVVFPESLNIKEFKVIWDEWIQHRKEIKHKLTPLQANKQLKELSKYDVKIVIQTVEKSIKNGWQGLFPPEDKKKAEPKPKTLDYLECTRCKSKTYHRLEHGRWLCKICEKEYRK